MFGELSRAELIGHVGRDPELQVTSEGTPYTKFSMAVDRYAGKDAQGKARRETTWHNIITWRGLAEMTEKFVKKGDLVYAAGELVIRKYTDKQGVSRQSIEVVADNVQILKESDRSKPSDDTDPFTPYDARELAPEVPL